MLKRPYSLPKLGAAMLLALASTHVVAAVDSNYYIADPKVKGRFEVFNDGKNTFIQAIGGLVVRGATADGERFIVKGVPNEIPAVVNGRPITITRGVAPVTLASTGTTAADPAAVIERINKLTAEVNRLSKSELPDTKPAAAPDQSWEIKDGERVIEGLSRWAKGKWKVMSSVEDRTSDIDINLTGSLEDSIGKVVDGMNKAGAGWAAQFYPDVKVLRIVEKK